MKKEGKKGYRLARGGVDIVSRGGANRGVLRERTSSLSVNVPWSQSKTGGV